MNPFSKLFLGVSTHPVDKKGRMSIAKRFQTALDADETGRPCGVLVAEPRGAGSRSLWVFNMEGFTREMAVFDQAVLDPATEAQDRHDFFEFVAPFSLDASGRLVLPAEFREVAGITDQAVLVGMNSRFEIWSKEAWDARPRGASWAGHAAGKES